MIKVLLYLWQLPQNILGLLVILFTGAFKTKAEYWVCDKSFGVSLGTYIIFGDLGGRMTISEKSIKHEQGHQKQSKIFGPLYLIVIGLPSFIFNIYDRLFHKDWVYWEKCKWYYSLPWEHWADRLGNVNRDSYGSI